MEETKKHPGGRPRNFNSPEELWDAFEKYTAKIKSNPILVHDFVGKDGISAHREREQPLTMEGFECFCMGEGYIGYPDLTDYIEGKHKEFLPISTRIRKFIRQDQIKGGMAGIYNASLTARINGLVDKTEKTVIQEQPLFGDGDK
jgi:hypothetical protein